ncbi:hypothetical protein [Ornithinibacillus sp. JPR2-1]|uniref:hypothetical protein n=1 Tax=Ornithinibacillus sp. JPR2-1 TaxID=2094019 RepID=UPI0031DB15E4
MSLDDFLTEVSSVLGVSQRVLETEYYMVDIPKLIEKKRKEQLADYFMQLQLSIASNNRVMEEEDYHNLVRNLTKILEEENKTEQNKLDRQKLEALRLMTNQGANRTRGG